MTTLEAEWGIAHGLDFVIWHKGQPPELLQKRLRESCGVDIKTQNTDALPAVTESVARRSTGERAKIVDLAPPTWRTEIFAGRAKKKFLVATGAFLVVWLIAVSAFFIVLRSQDSEITALQNMAKNLEGPALDVRQKKSKIRGLQLYADRSESALECLREVSTKLPQNVDLTQFNFKKAGGVVLRGEAPTRQPVYDFFEALEKSDLFLGISDESVTSQTKKGRQVSNFKVTAKLTEDAS